MTERREVVQNEEPAAKGSRDQVVLARLDLQVPDRDGRHAGFEPGPVVATVESDEESELGAHKEQAFLPRVLDHRPGKLIVRQIAGDVLPAHPAVVAPHHVGREIALLVVVEDGVHGVLPMPGGMEVRHVGERRHAGNGIHHPPFDPPVTADLDAPVVHSGVEQPLDER